MPCSHCNHQQLQYDVSLSYTLQDGQLQCDVSLSHTLQDGQRCGTYQVMLPAVFINWDPLKYYPLRKPWLQRGYFKDGVHLQQQSRPLYSEHKNSSYWHDCVTQIAWEAALHAIQATHNSSCFLVWHDYMFPRYSKTTSTLMTTSIQMLFMYVASIFMYIDSISTAYGIWQRDSQETCM